MDIIRNIIENSIDVKKGLLMDHLFISLLDEACSLCVNAYQNNRKILIAGNGGSAADAQHIAGELVSRLNFDRAALSAIALSTDTSILTAIGNDYGFDKVFSRQIEANGNENDVFIAISTSGDSPNILESLKVCKATNIKTIGLTGQKGGIMEKYCDVCLKVPSTITPRIQESHIMIGHILCDIIEKKLFKNDELASRY